MYEAHYGLSKKPFSLIPDPDFLYFSRGHKIALSLLQYGLTDQTGFVVISGEVGSGKTTLLRQLLRMTSSDVSIGLIFNTHPSFGHLITWVLKAFGLSAEGKDSIQQYNLFIDHVTGKYAAGTRTVLIFDEAQNLDADALEQVRLLSNLNADGDFMLQLVLVGQPELKETLRRPSLRQFTQRVSVFHDLKPLGVKDSIGYIRHRLATAGAAHDIFDVAACTAVHHYAYGTPRLINTLCDLALVHGYADDRQTIDVEVVIDAVDARQASGLEIFRQDPPELSANERKQAIFDAFADEVPELVIWSESENADKISYGRSN